MVIFILLSTSCDNNFLTRRPQSKLIPEDFYTNQNALKEATNGFYSIAPSAKSIDQTYADNAARNNPSERVKGTRKVSSTGGGWTWTNLRNVNFFLKHVNGFKGPENIKNEQKGLALFFRAWFYFKKVKRFGDVPWYSKVIQTGDEKRLHKARDKRSVVMDSILTDINFAVKHLGEQKSLAKVTKWTALALKSRIFLYAGTWREYHGMDDYKNLLKESVSASSKLMQSGKYSIYTDGGDEAHAYRKLFSDDNAKPQETILARIFSSTASPPLKHNLNYATNTSALGAPGVTKEVINSYLMTDGSRFTDISGHNKMSFYQETRNRDPRLAQTIRTPGFVRKGETKPTVPDFGASTTGYQFIKYVQGPAHDAGGTNDNDIIVFRYAEVLLNFAEAKAELGTLTQSDIDNSIKLIRDRVGMPNMNMAKANSNPDPFLEKQYPNVKGNNKGDILEIRRERRVELIREGIRWDDLMRWAVGENVAKTFKGMYFPGPGKYDLDHNGTIDLVIYQGSKPTNIKDNIQYKSLTSMHLENGTNGLMIINGNVSKNFVTPKDYLYPIPLQELQLNPNLKQNPGWKSK
jgi:hypothetical protein